MHSKFHTLFAASTLLVPSALSATASPAKERVAIPLFPTIERCMIESRRQREREKIHYFLPETQKNDWKIANYRDFITTARILRICKEHDYPVWIPEEDPLKAPALIGGRYLS